MWQYNHYDELVHYGVKGMRWGIRKGRKASVSILEAKRRRDRREYKREQWNDAVRNHGNPKTRSKMRERKKQQDYKDAKTAWLISKQKAKLDPKYKDSDEYKTAQRNHGREVTKKLLRDLTTISKKDM